MQENEVTSSAIFGDKYTIRLKDENFANHFYLIE